MADEIRIVRGSPTDEELAALVTVLVSRPTPATGGPAPVSWWTRSARPAGALRGPGAWRASALPR